MKTLEQTETIIILILVGIAAYAIYYFSENGFCNLLGSSFPGCDQPCAGGPGVTCQDQAGNFQTNPESYSAAATTSLEHPLDTLKSIFGY